MHVVLNTFVRVRVNPRPTSLSLNAINILQVDFLGEIERNADKKLKILDEIYALK